MLIGTGSEVQHCVAAAETLAAEGVAARVVSMPSWDLFDAQDDAYQVSVMGVDVPRVSVEAGTTFGWALYADASVGIDRFGASAPGGGADGAVRHHRGQRRRARPRAARRHAEPPVTVTQSPTTRLRSAR